MDFIACWKWSPPSLPVRSWNWQFHVLWEMELELPDAEYSGTARRWILSHLFQQKLADKVPLSDEPFTLEAYKAYSSALKILALSGKRIVLVVYLATAAEATWSLNHTCIIDENHCSRNITHEICFCRSPEECPPYGSGVSQSSREGDQKATVEW